MAWETIEARYVMSSAENKGRNLFDTELKVVNLGIDIFYTALKVQEVKVVQVEWKPSHKLDKESEDILSKIL
jgi:hypothetical protein